MTKVVVLSEDDYNAVLAQLNDARAVCAEAMAERFTATHTYYLSEIDRRLEYIQDILKKKEEESF